MICGSGGSKSRLAKAAGAEPSGQMRDENCTPLWREAHFEVKTHKTPQPRTTFGSSDVEKVHAIVAKHFEVKMYKTSQLRSFFRSCDVKKVHAVVARSTFPSQNVQNTPGSGHFLTFRCPLRGKCKGFCTLPKVSKT